MLAMGGDVVHHVNIPMKHSSSDVCLDECIHFIPLLRRGGKLGLIQ